jgi:hypothetical protein
MLVRPTSPALLALLLLCSAACGGEEEARVTVGLTTDIAVGFDIESVERTAKIDGAVTLGERLSYDQGELRLPEEIALPAAPDDAAVEVTIAAFREGEAAPLLTRTARTRAEGGRRLFLPVSLDEACAGVTCAAGATCVAGACGDPFLAPSALADHDPAWIVSATDACKTPAAGAPTLVLGKGSSAFASLAEGEVVAIEPGPQGGHHVWLALQVKGLRQMGSKVKVAGHYPALAFEVRSFTSQITLRKVGDHCEIYGIRFQVDRDIPVETIKGQPLDIEVSLEDPNGDIATAEKQVIIAP